MAKFTVIGYWDDADYPIAVGVIVGDHQVTGGEGCSEGGPWATCVDARTADAATLHAVQEMEASTTDGEVPC